ncbi:avidin [Chelonia mydas]|uniref:avidin n=1 Tax=Chelonia mydas TaxID=8469 RepID=UPI0018A21F05|nr:avidin [Chelonia mydas]
MGKMGFSLVLALFLVTIGASSERKCILTGDWKNDLGSNMTISAVNEAGQFSGLYLTAVSATEKPIVESPLTGSQHVDNLEQPTFGFTVKWSFSDSTTVFVGQCFMDDQGKETLQTMWLLRVKAKSMGDNWNATMVGTNVFTRKLEEQNLGESVRSDL